jgi:hypothetical protein
VRQVQAVILIHGIGEQKPMDTLRRFVDAVWTRDTAIHHPHAGSQVWSKPDTVSDSYELRRLLTPQNQAGISTEFFEFYWAHLMEGTSYGHVLAWTRSLLLRRPVTIPKHLRLVYGLVVVMLVAALGLGVAVFATRDGGIELPGWISLGISVLLLPAAGLVIRSIVGDAARYLRAAPTNVQCRHEIRQAGITLLEALHKRGYDRIIVVGHSLGSVIGYDILTHAWVDYHDQPNALGVTAALDALEAEAASPSGATDSELQAMQRRYFEELAGNGNRWRVTDFITLGSPLAHADILLARDAADLDQKQVDRELPTCLPTLERLKRGGRNVLRFSFGEDEDRRMPNYAAVFGPTRWTNLYFPCTWIVRGDLIGGQLRPLFGRAVRDCPVTTAQCRGFLSHTRYWRLPATAKTAPPHITALRDALNLMDRQAVPARGAGGGEAGGRDGVPLRISGP